MERTYIKDITPGVRKVSGFVENFRNKRTMAFIVIKDITGKLQVTVEKSTENNDQCNQQADEGHENHGDCAELANFFAVLLFHNTKNSF